MYIKLLEDDSSLGDAGNIVEVAEAFGEALIENGKAELADQPEVEVEPKAKKKPEPQAEE
jgi:ribosomal protein L9